MTEFVAWPHPALRRTAAPVEIVDQAVEATWRRLLDAMYGRMGLVGLAAPQIGESVALAVVDCSDSRCEPVRLANPRILSASEESEARREGSPNLPGLWAGIDRPVAVRVRFLDASGELVERDFEGLWARSVQHQIDHLAGRMFFDRLSRLKRERLLARHAKQARRRA